MITTVDEAERLRLDASSADRQRGRHPDSAGCIGACIMGITKTVTTYPTSAGKFVAFQCADVMGTETEGSTGVVTGVGDTQYALIPTGAAIPATGTPILVVWVPNRWVADL